LNALTTSAGPIRIIFVDCNWAVVLKSIETFTTESGEKIGATLLT
jgi:hypothetical protein